MLNFFSANQCPDSFEHTLLACSAAEIFYHEMTVWFIEQKSQFNMNYISSRYFPLIIFPVGSQHLMRWKFGIFILMKMYICDCKMMEKFPRGNQFKRKVNI